MKYYMLLWAVFVFSCSNEKSVQLPQIDHSGRSLKESAAETFMKYHKDPTEPLRYSDSNLKATKSWFFYIDHRISLKWMLPETIKLLDRKKRLKIDGKNTGKNYFAFKSNGTKEVQFWDMTDVVFHNGIDGNIMEDQIVYQLPQLQQRSHIMSIIFRADDSISINSAPVVKSEFVKRLKYMDSVQNKMVGYIYLKFDESLTFQEYLDYKSLIDMAELKNATISNDEYIFN